MLNMVMRSYKLSQEHRFLQAVLHFGVLQVRLEILAPVFRAVPDVIQVIGTSGTDDVVCQQDAAFPEKATFLKNKREVCMRG